MDRGRPFRCQRVEGEELLVNPSPHAARAWAMAGILLFGFLLIATKLCLLQTTWHPDLSIKAEDIRERTVKRDARRGKILDARGNILAQSLPVRTVCADPIAMKKVHPTEVPFIAQQLANLLGLD